MGAGLATVKSWLSHPLTRGRDLDDPRTTELRRQIICEKKFLKRIYVEWYTAIADALPRVTGPVLELGSGGGFMSEYVPELITSDILPCAGVERVVDAQNLPFADGELRGIVMTNVLHHIPRPRRFFAEARRCVRVGGAVVMIEPWMSAWSQAVYSRLHHEPFDKAAAWEFPSSGPLSDANGALPWILFSRDRSVFEAEFREWRITTVQPIMPLRYLLSGGVSLRNLVPNWSFSFWRGFERLLSPWMRHLAMFAIIVLTRVDATPATENASSSPRESTGVGT